MAEKSKKPKLVFPASTPLSAWKKLANNDKIKDKDDRLINYSFMFNQKNATNKKNPPELSEQQDKNVSSTWTTYKNVHSKNPLTCSGSKTDKKHNGPGLLKANNTRVSGNNNGVLKSTKTSGVSRDKNIIPKEIYKSNQSGVAKGMPVQRLPVAASKNVKTDKTLLNLPRPSQCKALVPVKHGIPPKYRNLPVQTHTNILNEKKINQPTKPIGANKNRFQQIVPFQGKPAIPLVPPGFSGRDPKLQHSSRRNSKSVPMKILLPDKALLEKSKIDSGTKKNDLIKENMLVKLGQKPPLKLGELIQAKPGGKKLETFNDKVHQTQQKENTSRKESIEESVEAFLSMLPVKKQLLPLPASVKCDAKKPVVTSDVTNTLFSETKKIYKRIKTFADKQIKDAKDQRISIMKLPSFKRKPIDSRSIADAEKKIEGTEGESFNNEKSTDDTSMQMVSVVTTKDRESNDVLRFYCKEDAKEVEPKQDAIINKQPQTDPTTEQTTSENAAKNEDSSPKRKLFEWESENDMQESSQKKTKWSLDQRSDSPAYLSGEGDYMLPLPSSPREPEVTVVNKDVIDEVIDLVGDAEEANAFVPYNPHKPYKPPKTTNKSSRPLYDFELFYGLAGPLSADALKFRSSLIPDVPWSTPVIERHALFYRRMP